jgi:hypothetical protein
LQSAFGHYGVHATQYWTGARFVLPPNPGDYYTDAGPENRLVYQGKFMLLNEVASSSSETPGVLMVRYKVRLWQSKLDGTAGSVGPNFNGSFANTLTAANPLGTGTYTAGTNSSWVGPTFSATSTDSVITFPSGLQAFFVLIRASGAACTTWTFSDTNLTLDSTDYFDQEAGSSGTVYMVSRVYTIDDSSLASTLSVHLTTFTTPSATRVVLIPLRWKTSLTIEKEIRRDIGRLEASARSLRERLMLLEVESDHDQDSKYSALDEKQSLLTAPPSPTTPRSDKVLSEYVDLLPRVSTRSTFRTRDGVPPPLQRKL